MVMQVKRTPTPNNPPTGLAEGQLAVGMADTPPTLWAGVPTSIDPSGRVLLNPQYVPAPPPDVSAVPVGGRLGIIGASPASQIGYFPFNGGWIRIDGADYPLPAAGITAGLANVYVDGVAGQTLALSTFYYVYLFDNGGVLTMDFSATGHATSVTSGNVGVEIKQGDETRTLIGIVWPFSSAFYDQPDFRLVRSWLNRSLTTGTAAGATSAGPGFTLQGVNLRFVNFAGEAVFGTVSGGAQPDIATIMYYGLTLDGTIDLGNNGTNAAVGQFASITFSSSTLPSEGVHVMYVWARTNGGNLTGTAQLNILY